MLKFIFFKKVKHNKHFTVLKLLVIFLIAEGERTILTELAASALIE